MEALIGAKFINRQDISICRIDWQVEITKNIMPLAGSALDESTVEGLEPMEDEYRKPAMDTLTEKMDHYLDIMYQKTTFRKAVTQPHTLFYKYSGQIVE